MNVNSPYRPSNTIAVLFADAIVKIKAEAKKAIAEQKAEEKIESETANTASDLYAKEVMRKELVWGSPEDSVQQTLAKIQAHDTGYILIGQDGVLEGIVSKSDLTGAISPYLRPVFAKWHRPLDDATLQIKVKWIMSSPVRIIKPETSLADIMGDMCRSGVLCLPVVDQQGKVQGLVTEADIFKVLLILPDKDSVSDEMVLIQTRAKELASQKTDLEAQVSRLKEKVADNERLRAELTKVTNERQLLAEQIRRLMARLEEANKVRDTLETDMAASHEAVCKLRKEMEQLQDKVTGDDSGAADPRAQLVAQSTELAAANERLQVEIAARRQMEETLRDIKSRLQALSLNKSKTPVDLLNG